MWGAESRVMSETTNIAERRTTAELEAAIERGCWVYGAGSYGRGIANLLQARGTPARGFIDRRAAEAGAPGLPERTIAPDRVDAAAVASTTLIVALHNYAADQGPVVAWAKAAGFAETIVPAELPDLLGPEAGSYWLTGKAHTRAHLAEIDRLLDLLADDASRAVVRQLARFRISGDIAEHPASHLPSQYFPRDVPFPAGPLRVVDGGAYTGDLLDAARGGGVEIGAWWAFEPDPANFARLIDTAAEAHIAETALFPCGLGATCDQVRFASGEEAGSHLGTGEAVAQVVALDQILPGITPSYVKLDIEGFERAAITGMRETLLRARPALAVAIYHKPEDLWALPLTVHDLLPDARLFVRQHGFNGFDTVLYAVP